MPKSQQSREYHCLMGALLADCAALGLHWLYDQARIREVAPTTPEFHSINLNDYEGAPGYFAHAARQDGDLSQYGEQLWTLMTSLDRNNGAFLTQHYEQTFRHHFGYGGAYVGYIDRPTRDTLDNITRNEAQLLKSADALEFSGTQQDRHTMMTKVRAYSQMLTGEALRERVKDAVKQTHDAPEMIEYAFALCDLVEKTDPYHGADDQQLPAVAKLPALAATGWQSADYAQLIDKAVRVTNNNDTAVHYAVALGELLKTLVQGNDMATAVANCRACADASLSIRFDQLDAAHGLSINDAVKQFGMACDLDQAFLSILYILQNTTSYAHAVQANIYAGGDSCGRAIIIGAAFGALYQDDREHGIPDSWISNLRRSESLSDLARRLVA